MIPIHTDTCTLRSGETLFYRTAQTGRTPIVLLHGNMASSVFFERLINTLSDDYSVFAPDLRGFGQSSYTTQSLSVYDYALDIKQFIERLGLDKPIVLGFEFGGAIALKLLSEFRFIARGLVLMSSISVAGRPIRRRVLFGMIKTRDYLKTKGAIEKFITPVERYKRDNQRWLIKQMFAQDIFTLNKPTSEEMETFIDAFMQQRNLADVYMALTYFNIFSDDNGVAEGEHKAKDIAVPVLSLHGDKNDVVPLGAAKLNERAIGRNVTTKVINGAGHALFFDAPSAVKEYLDTFVNTLDKNKDDR